MNLLMDLGHSRLKWTLNDGLWQVETAAIRADALADAMDRWKAMAPRRVLVAASVGHPFRDELAGRIQSQLGPVAEWPSSPAQLGVLTNAYGEPGKLGIDRFLAMLAAHDSGLAPCVVADCGTALTLDALSGDGRHLGGAIVPGRALMREALARTAPALGMLPAGMEVDLAASSSDALSSGVAYALAGAVSRFRKRNAGALGADAGLVLTGGDGAWLAGLLDEDSTALEHAVLRGLAVWAQLVPGCR